LAHVILPRVVSNTHPHCSFAMGCQSSTPFINAENLDINAEGLSIEKRIASDAAMAVMIALESQVPDGCQAANEKELMNLAIQASCREGHVGPSRGPDAQPAATRDDSMIAAMLTEMEVSEQTQPDRNTETALHAAGEDQCPAPEPSPERIECITCCATEANACLIPCSHINVCVECSSKLNPKLCPTCRTPFEAVIQICRPARTVTVA